MKTNISQVYLGDLRVQSTHSSGVQLLTDAPVDHSGLGRSFAPTDLLATSLGCGALTAMSIAAADEGWDMTGTKATTHKVIPDDGLRLVEWVIIDIEFANTVTVDQAEYLKEIAYNNPVYLSVQGGLCVHFNFTWIN